MKTHQDIDQRSLDLARKIVAIIEGQCDRQGLAQARNVCERWIRVQDSPPVREWHLLLQQPWFVIRERYTDPGEEGRRLRQNSPFCGILDPRERWDFFRRWEHDHEPGAA